MKCKLKKTCLAGRFLYNFIIIDKEMKLTSVCQNLNCIEGNPKTVDLWVVLKVVYVLQFAINTMKIAINL
jgi:hypothetical protein